jgi:hypothetical protein
VGTAAAAATRAHEQVRYGHAAPARAMESKERMRKWSEREHENETHPDALLVTTRTTSSLATRSHRLIPSILCSVSAIERNNRPRPKFVGLVAPFFNSLHPWLLHLPSYTPSQLSTRTSGEIAEFGGIHSAVRYCRSLVFAVAKND